MATKNTYTPKLITHFLILSLLAAFACWLKSLEIETGWQKAGLTTFSLGFVLLAAYVISKMLVIAKLPLISGYIFAGIIAGPYITGFLTEDMVHRLRLVDDLALSFIALTAGGTLHMQFLRKRGKAIVLNTTFLILVVFGLVFIAVILLANFSSLTPDLTKAQLMVFACLLGVISVARSPSSAIAIISECRASGVFTATVMGVTVVMDVLLIILFTLALAVSNIILTAGSAIDYQTFMVLSLAVAGSLLLGVFSGKCISFYIKKIGHDLPLFLLFVSFGVFKTSLWLNHFMEAHFATSLHLEPLLICMSAGFTVQNFSKTGPMFMESLDYVSLPIYVLFFSLAGASLNLDALRMTWPLAVSLVLVRITGIFVATWFAGILNRDPAEHNRTAWMAYITQAGVAIGLAQLAQRHFPEIGMYLTTVVLAVITVNQVVGPITFKMALNMVGETGKE